ncbi:MAG: hypothetical protein CL799_04380 [Chromatiales bacterium]|nr:hypothetical protein [Chromatiales bacterium]
MYITFRTFRAFMALAALTYTVAFAPAFAAPIPEITVTATRRETNIQDTSIAITALGETGLKNTGIDTMASLAKFVPNMVVGQNNNDTQVMIRGIGTSDTTIVSDPSVAIHLDDMYITRTSGLNMLMYDTERVEVLRGPQGTLYGRNATGGSVNIISKRPNNEFGLSTDVLTGDYDRFQFRGALNLPIIDEKLAGRISVVHEDRDGYQENVFPGGTESNDADALAWRAQLLWTPSDKLSVLLKVDDVDFDDVGQQRERLDSPAGNPANAFQGTLAEPRELHKVYKDTPESRELESTSQLMRVDWQFSDAAELTFIAGGTEMFFDFLLDADQDAILFSTVGHPGTSSDSNSQELRLASTTDKPLQWLVGLYRLEEDASQPLLVVNDPGVTINNMWKMESDSQAVFGQLSYELTDEIKLLGGLRHTRDEKTGRGSNEICIPFFNFCPVPERFVFADDSWDETTWLIGADWTPSDDHLYYGKISTGYKAGGFNLIGADPEDTVWDPEEVKSLEIGWKGTLNDGKLRLNTAAFYYDYDDLQVASIINFSRLTTNAAKATVKGVELEAIMQPADGWLINLGIGWLQAEFDEFIGVDPINVPQGSVPPGEPDPIPEDFSGNDLVNSPDWSINFGIQYTFDLGEKGTLLTRLQSHWQDDWYLRPYNLPEDMQDSYATTDVRLIWRSEEDHWSAEAFVNNVSDSLRATSVEVTNGGFFGNINPPQTWGVRIGYNY